jgi:hypothetical protein
LGWSPSKPTQNLRHASETIPGSGRATRGHSRNGSTTSLASNVGLGIGLGGDSSGNMGFTNLLRRKSSSGRSRKSSGELSTGSGSNDNLRTGSKDMDRRRKALSMVTTSDTPPSTSTSNSNSNSNSQEHGQRPGYMRTKSDIGVNVDASAGWRGERVLYQCACVASLYVPTLCPNGQRGALTKLVNQMKLVEGDIED